MPQQRERDEERRNNGRHNRFRLESILGSWYFVAVYLVLGRTWYMMHGPCAMIISSAWMERARNNLMRACSTFLWSKLVITAYLQTSSLFDTYHWNLAFLGS